MTMCGLPSQTAVLPTARKLHMTQMYRVMTTTKEALEREKPKPREVRGLVKVTQSNTNACYEILIRVQCGFALELHESFSI